MATRTITTRLAVDGETEFKRAMSGVNSELRTLKSELALADAEFRGQANSLEYLSRKQDILSKEYQQQGEKVKALEQAVRDSTDAYGENDRKTQEYKRQLNQARIELINLNNALQDNERYLREAEQSADGTADSIDELGREIEDTDGALDGAGKSGLKFGDILKANVVSSVIIGGLKKLASFLSDFAKSSIEAGKAFDSAMSQVAATMGVTINQIGKLRDFAFQPTSPVRETTRRCCRCEDLHGFQPTSPVRETTSDKARQDLEAKLFQPTSPVRETTGLVCAQVHPDQISTHVPRAGDD